MVSWVGCNVHVEYVEQNIFKNDEGFYFEDETQSDLCGPYLTIQDARDALKEYAAWLNR